MTEIIDLSPATLDLKLYSGDGVRFRLVVTNKDNNPVPLTGAIEAQIRHKRGEADPPKATFDVDLSDSTDGIVVLSLTGVQTQELALIKKFSGVWDIQWTPFGDQPRTLCQGTVECGVDVSR